MEGTKHRIGRHRDVSRRLFDKKQLEMGLKVEKEHTDIERLALEIAKDHLSEIPDYYSRLELIERKDFWDLIKK